MQDTKPVDSGEALARLVAAYARRPAGPIAWLGAYFTVWALLLTVVRAPTRNATAIVVACLGLWMVHGPEEPPPRPPRRGLWLPGPDDPTGPTIVRLAGPAAILVDLLVHQLPLWLLLVAWARGGDHHRRRPFCSPGGVLGTLALLGAYLLLVGEGSESQLRRRYHLSRRDVVVCLPLATLVLLGALLGPL